MFCSVGTFHENTIWMAVVFFGLIYVAPVLMIMMALFFTDIPLSYAAICWLPIAVIGTLVLTFLYHRQGIKSVENQL